jgi:hypothetical protein
MKTIFIAALLLLTTSAFAENKKETEVRAFTPADVRYDYTCQSNVESWLFSVDDKCLVYVPKTNSKMEAKNETSRSRN